MWHTTGKHGKRKKLLKRFFFCYFLRQKSLLFFLFRNRQIIGYFICSWTTNKGKTLRAVHHRWFPYFQNVNRMIIKLPRWERLLYERFIREANCERIHENKMWRIYWAILLLYVYLYSCKATRSIFRKKYNHVENLQIWHNFRSFCVQPKIFSIFRRRNVMATVSKKGSREYFQQDSSACKKIIVQHHVWECKLTFTVQIMTDYAYQFLFFTSISLSVMPSRGRNDCGLRNSSLHQFVVKPEHKLRNSLVLGLKDACL